jgi:glutamate racemase
MGPGATLVSPGEETAKRVAVRLAEASLLAERARRGAYRYFVSDSTEDFVAMASHFLQMDVTGDVARVSLDRFR